MIQAFSWDDPRPHFGFPISQIAIIRYISGVVKERERCHNEQPQSLALRSMPAWPGSKVRQEFTPGRPATWDSAWRERPAVVTILVKRDPSHSFFNFIHGMHTCNRLLTGV